jgi:hypothetical protein
MHTIQKIKKYNKVEVVEGMSAAVRRVKELQNQYAIEILHNYPNLKVENGFSVITSLNPKYLEQSKKIDIEGSIERRFDQLLQDLSKQYIQFPKYMIELLAKDYYIEKKDLESLIRQFLNKKKLIRVNNYYFAINR